mmetsp:Transcript_93723/g.166754  ORF Transcript_93723/g.166754 Transcript_93723/m.166754 type:complete len:901 (-) Transcript_93723:269-2971(-)
MRGPQIGDGAETLWRLKRQPGMESASEDFVLSLQFVMQKAASEKGDASGTINVAGLLAPLSGGNEGMENPEELFEDAIELDGQLLKANLCLRHASDVGELIYQCSCFEPDGDGQFQGVWRCGLQSGQFSLVRLKSSEEPRKRKSACRRKACAEIKSKRFFNDLKDELSILERLGWSEKRWKEESKLEKGRAILGELRRELSGILQELGLRFLENTPILEQVERGIGVARESGDEATLKRLRASDCTKNGSRNDLRSDWHTLFEIQRHFCVLPAFRATRYLEPSNIRHSLRCAEVFNRSDFEGGRYIGGAGQLSEARMPRESQGSSVEGNQRAELRQKMMQELCGDCIAGELSVEAAYHVQIQLVIRAGCSEFIWEPGPDVKIHYLDRVYYEPAHVTEDRRGKPLSDFEKLLTGGRENQVYEEDFEFVEMTARAEGGAAEGVPAFLEHSVIGNVEDAEHLFQRNGKAHSWERRPKALNLGSLFRIRLAGYRHHRGREIIWGPGPETRLEKGDRPLRLLRMAHEPVRVRFCRHEAPFGFHLVDLRSGSGGVEVVEVVEGSPADARGVVVGRTIKRLLHSGTSEDVRHWTKPQLEEALRRMPDQFSIEFGKGDTEERRLAPLGDAEMTILMDERFMRGFLHELWQGQDETQDSGLVRHFDSEGWAAVFPGLEVCSAESRTPSASCCSSRESTEAFRTSSEAAPVQPVQALGGKRLELGDQRASQGSIGDSDSRRSSGASSSGSRGRNAARNVPRHQLDAAQPQSIASASWTRERSPMKVSLPSYHPGPFSAALIDGDQALLAAGMAAPPGLSLPATGLAGCGSAPPWEGWQPLLLGPGMQKALPAQFNNERGLSAAFPPSFCGNSERAPLTPGPQSPGKASWVDPSNSRSVRKTRMTASDQRM